MPDPALENIRRAVALLFTPGDTVEVRVPKAGRAGTIAGYFSDLDKLVEAVGRLNCGGYPGVYWTINPVDSSLLARYPANRTVERAQELTAEENVLCWRRFAIDLDPKRPSGISATDAQHEAALDTAAQLYEELRGLGWPAAIRADSGNGAHLVYGIDLPNDREGKDLVRRVLQALAMRVAAYPSSGIQIDVDLSMAKPAQICKCWGTWARKGQNTPERPHRQSKLLDAPDTLEVVPRDRLERLAVPAQQQGHVPATPSRQGGAVHTPARDSFDLRRFLDDHGVRYGRALSYKGGTKYQLDECPFDSSHKAPDSAVFEFSDGFAFKCLHNSCADHGWADFREHFDPGYKERRERASWRSAARSEGHDSRTWDGIPLPAAPPDLASPAEGDVETGRDAPAELPLSVADVEAAAAVAIETQSQAEVMRLARAIATLRPCDQAIIVGKLRDGFKADWKELEKWFDKALRDATAEKKSSDSDETGQNSGAKPPAGEGDGEFDGKPDLTGYPLTDSGNGQRIVALYGDEIRYCNEMETWFIWDGRRWAPDRVNLMRHKVMEMARLLYYQALKLPADGSMRIIVSKHARATESSKGITNALKEAASKPGIPVSAHSLDQYPNHLNFRNGTVNLQDGTTQKHDRTMLLTKLCEHDYRPEAKAPVWQGFVEWTMGGPEDANPDAELPEVTVRLVSFLQRVLGYSITGQVGEKAVFVFYGEGGDNGKTTLLTVIRELLGRDYASLLLIDTIMHARSTDNTAREDMADLRGARFVQTSEISKEDRLNEQRVKFLTQGMGTIKSRRLHEHLIEFVATHKLLMDCNYRPKVTGQDNAIWRRLIQVPFNYTIAEERKDLKFPEKLKAEAEGILAWLVRGAVEWHNHGLGKPPEVVEAGTEWREHDDPLREFLSDWCDEGPDMICPVSDLMPAYLLWAKEYGEKFPLTRRGFNELLVGKGIKQEKNRADLSYYGVEGKEPVRVWVGVRLKVAVLPKLRYVGSRSPRDEDVPRNMVQRSF